MAPRPTRENDELAAETFAERERLADLLSGLGPDQWAHPSLCDGWRVREVVAHMTLPYRHSSLRVLAGIAAARGRFDVFADRIARQDTAKHPDDELLASLRANLRNPWRPPGGGQAGALSHDVIHGLDITGALGLPSPPTERVRAVLDHSTVRSIAYFGVDLTSTRLEATDTDWHLGEGTPLRGTAAEMLLVLTGRRAVPTPA